MKVRVADIVAIASDITGYRAEAITGRSRKRFIVRVRQAVYFVAREQGHSYPDIGRRLGRDHSTVITGRETAINFMGRSPKFARLVDALSRRVNQQSQPFADARLVPQRVAPTPVAPPVLFALDGPSERADHKRKDAYIKGSAELAGALARARAA